jgi:hypothetical protein
MLPAVRVAGVLLVAVVLTGCGASDPEQASEERDPVAQQVADEARAAARKKQARRDRSRARKITAYFREQEMTPSDLYAAGVDAPQPMLEVYSIEKITVSGSKVTIKTNLYPKGENKNVFAGACNQVIAGALEDSWIKEVEVEGQDDIAHGSWTDRDKDDVDDASGFMACQSDL